MYNVSRSRHKNEIEKYAFCKIVTDKPHDIDQVKYRYLNLPPDDALITWRYGLHVGVSFPEDTRVLSAKADQWLTWDLTQLTG